MVTPDVYMRYLRIESGSLEHGRLLEVLRITGPGGDEHVVRAAYALLADVGDLMTTRLAVQLAEPMAASTPGTVLCVNVQNEVSSLVRLEKVQDYLALSAGQVFIRVVVP